MISTGLGERFLQTTPPQRRAHRAPAFAILVSCLVLSGPSTGRDDAVGGAPRSDTAPPNIVLIVADDLGYPYHGFMGNPIVKTPNLDGLAKAGTTFTTGYVTASACRPSLLSLLTGVHPYQWDQQRRHLDWDGSGAWATRRYFESLPALLAERGYASFQAGKWWEGTYADAGFSAGTKTSTSGGGPMNWWMGGVEGLKIGRTTMQPIYDFIDTHRGAPFFLWFAPKLPHRPWNAPQQFDDLYAGRGLSGSAAAYYANVSWFDHAVGQLISHLDVRDLLSRTLVVYLSDNGFRQGPHEDWRELESGKGSMKEIGFRTPIVFRWRGRIQTDVVREELVSSLDVFPTLLAYAGIPTPANRSGVDLAPLLEGRSDAPPRRELVGHMQGPEGPIFFVRGPRWHYIWYPEDGEDELYDVQVDPEEQSNVIAERGDLIEAFRQRIRLWKERMSAPPGVAMPRRPDPGRVVPADRA